MCFNRYSWVYCVRLFSALNERLLKLFLCCRTTGWDPVTGMCIANTGYNSGNILIRPSLFHRCRHTKPREAPPVVFGFALSRRDERPGAIELNVSKYGIGM